MFERNSLEARLDALETRISEVEQATQHPSGHPGMHRLTKMVDERIEREELDPAEQPVGQVDFAFILRFGKSGTMAYQDDVEIEMLLALPDDVLAKAISGLAHPVRIKLFKALLTGMKESAELLEIAGLNTTGQLYHHLQAMADVGLAERRGRNQWACQNQAAFLLLLMAGHTLSRWLGEE